MGVGVHFVPKPVLNEGLEGLGVLGCDLSTKSLASRFISRKKVMMNTLGPSSSSM